MEMKMGMMLYSLCSWTISIESQTTTDLTFQFRKKMLKNFANVLSLGGFVILKYNNNTSRIQVAGSVHRQQLL